MIVEIRVVMEEVGEEGALIIIDTKLFALFPCLNVGHEVQNVAIQSSCNAVTAVLETLSALRDTVLIKNPFLA